MPATCPIGLPAPILFLGGLIPDALGNVYYPLALPPAAPIGAFVFNQNAVLLPGLGIPVSRVQRITIGGL